MHGLVLTPLLSYSVEPQQNSAFVPYQLVGLNGVGAGAITYSWED